MTLLMCGLLVTHSHSVSLSVSLSVCVSLMMCGLLMNGPKIADDVSSRQ